MDGWMGGVSGEGGQEGNRKSAGKLFIEDQRKLMSGQDESAATMNAAQGRGRADEVSLPDTE